jgi:preprotein translocase subunit SecA
VERLSNLSRDEVRQGLLDLAEQLYDEKERQVGSETMRRAERWVMLSVIDALWVQHLTSVDDLREGIGLRAYGQRDPLVEYQHEGYAMFMDMISRIKEETLEYLFKIQAVKEEKEAAPVFNVAKQQLVHEEKSQFQDLPQSEEAASAVQYEGQLPEQRVETFHRDAPKVGRNDPCSCGSGKKYKKCCGAAEGA